MVPHSYIQYEYDSVEHNNNYSYGAMIQRTSLVLMHCLPTGPMSDGDGMGLFAVSGAMSRSKIVANLTIIG